MEGDEVRVFGHAVDQLMEDLTSSLHTVVNDVKIRLYDEFTEHERQVIDNSGTDIDKVISLFTSLKTKSVDAHHKCVNALEELGHHDVAEKLREKIKSFCSAKAVAGSVAGKQNTKRLKYLIKRRKGFVVCSNRVF